MHKCDRRTEKQTDTSRQHVVRLRATPRSTETQNETCRARRQSVCQLSRHTSQDTRPDCLSASITQKQQPLKDIDLHTYAGTGRKRRTTYRCSIRLAPTVVCSRLGELTRGRTDHFSVIFADRDVSAGCYLFTFTVTNSSLLFTRGRLSLQLLR